MVLGKARCPHGHRAGIQTRDTAGDTCGQDQLQKNQEDGRRAARSESKIAAFKKLRRLGGNLFRNQLDRRWDHSDDGHIGNRSVGEPRDQTVVLGMRRLVVKKMVKPFRSRKREQGEPKSQHPQRSHRLSIAANTTE